jgi:uncharacterized membrane protein
VTAHLAVNLRLPSSSQLQAFSLKVQAGTLPISKVEPATHLPVQTARLSRPPKPPAQPLLLTRPLLLPAHPLALLHAHVTETASTGLVFFTPYFMNLKKYILAGLLVWLPLAITLWVLSWLVGALDSILANVLYGLGSVLPQVHTDALQQLNGIKGLGVVMVFLVLVLTGALASNVAGRWMVKQWDKLFTHIPIVKSIYTSVKKVSDTLFSSNGNAFRKAVLLQYPRQGTWTIAFQTGTPQGEVQSHVGEGFMSVYVPTTPNPTSGFFLLVPVADVIELDMSVDEALTYVISMGAVSPAVLPTELTMDMKS